MHGVGPALQPVDRRRMTCGQHESVLLIGSIRKVGARGARMSGAPLRFHIVSVSGSLARARILPWLNYAVDT
jgi:hypothetical protein